MSDLGFNIWGTIAAVLGTVGSIPVFIVWLNTRLPRTLLPCLESLLQETQGSFVTGLWEGLLTDESEIRSFHTLIRTIKGQVEDVRAEGYSASTWCQDVWHWYQGLSGKISDTHLKLDRVRAKLAKAQSGKRKLLEAQGYPDKRSISPYAMELLQEYMQGSVLLLTPPFTPSACDGDGGSTCSPCTPSQMSPSSLGPTPVAAAHNEASSKCHTCNTGSQSSRASTPSFSNHDEKHHLISDADLRDLVSLALSSLRSRQASDSRGAPSVTAQEAALQGAPKPVSNNGLYAQRQSKLAIRRAKHTGIKADWLYRPIVRRSLAAIGMASAHPQLDLESLSRSFLFLPPCAPTMPRHLFPYHVILSRATSSSFPPIPRLLYS
ncbi:hypothetical protein C8Q73DRAFT_796245 [Cubamyces lactineus]|nr:hypothetical protein C8Q73DRAFT_796245 [Cubamyces lactineus]